MIQPFSITSDSLQLVTDLEDGNTKLNYIDLASGITSLAIAITPVGEYNAIGFNAIDYYLYGYNETNHKVVKIGIDSNSNTYPYVATEIEILNLPTEEFNVGDVDSNGVLYLYQSGDNEYFKIDLNAKSFSNIAITGLDIQDWAVSPSLSTLYTVDSNGNYYEINSDDGTIEYEANLLREGLYQAFFADNEGNIYTNDNNTGTIYKIMPKGSSTNFIELATDTGDVAQDGARLATTSIDLLSANKTTGLDLSSVSRGGILNYFVEITNNSSSLTANDVMFTDNYADSFVFSDNSVLINEDLVLWGADPKDGVNLGTIAPNGSMLVGFQVQCLTTVPVGITISNTALVSYASGVTVESNNITVNVNDSNVSLRKSANKSIALVSDVVSYKIIIDNLTNITLTGLSLGDVVTPIDGTLKLNGNRVSTSSESGTVYIDDISIPANDNVLVTYQVKVVPGYQAIGYIQNGAELSILGQQQGQESNNVYVQVPPLGRGVLFID